MLRRRVGRTAAAAMALALTALAPTLGCTSVDPLTGESEASKTARGATIGAATGAAAGLVFADDHRERRKRALIGAGVGALAGGAVGAYMDRQEARLREELAGTGVSVGRAGEVLVLDMPGNVTFDVDRAEIRASFYAVLTSVSRVLKEFDRTVIEVAAHTDSTGSDAYNRSLSERRADAVRRYLRVQGIDDLRIVALGWGEARPVAPNATRAGRERNRRVELTLIPLTRG